MTVDGSEDAAIKPHGTTGYSYSETDAGSEGEQNSDNDTEDTDVQTDAFKQTKIDFWIKHKNGFWGVHKKVVLFVAIPWICVYIVMFYLSDKHFGTNASRSIHVLFLLPMCVCYILCGRKISSFTDALFLKRLFCLFSFFCFVK